MEHHPINHSFDTWATSVYQAALAFTQAYEAMEQKGLHVEKTPAVVCVLDMVLQPAATRDDDLPPAA